MTSRLNTLPRPCAPKVCSTCASKSVMVVLLPPCMAPSIALTYVYKSAWIPNDSVGNDLQSQVVGNILRNGTVDVCPCRTVKSWSELGLGVGRRNHCLYQYDVLTSRRIYDSFTMP